MPQHLRLIHAEAAVHLDLGLLAAAPQLPGLAAGAVGKLQAVVAGQVGRRVRPAVLAQVGGAGADVAPVAGQLARDQVGLPLRRADADRQVDRLVDHIGVVVAEPHVQRHLRVAPHQLRQQRADGADRQGHRRGHAQHADRFAVAAGSGVVGLVQRGQDLRRVLIVVAAAVGQRDAAGRAVQQGGAEAHFQRVDQPRDRGRGHAQVAGGGGKAAIAGDQAEGFEFGEPVHGRLCVWRKGDCRFIYIISRVAHDYNNFLCYFPGARLVFAGIAVLCLS
jgi:hypothetical protein